MLTLVGRGAEEGEDNRKGDEIMMELVVCDDDQEQEEEEEEEEEVRALVRKKRRVTGNVQSLLEAVIARQQRFFSDLLESMERKEQIRERIRQEREDKWREEERAQLGGFNNALIALTRELVGDGVAGGLHGVTGVILGGNHHPPANRSRRPSRHAKARFKNWKRAEVVQLIKLRGEMYNRFAMADSATRAELWDELGERLLAQGFRRDGKQCREKWERLMTLYNEAAEGKRDSDETPYFRELTNVLRRPGTAA
ncbi:unnamed protein product [Calypogeia fissa]